MDLSVPQLKNMCKSLNIQNYSKKKKAELIKLIHDHNAIKPIILDNSSIFYFIYHISDIHLRPIDRHDEFISVFNNLYSFFKTTNNGLIVITGDIFDNKYETTPNMIHIFQDFILNLLNFHSIVIIAGNHDINLDNRFEDKIESFTKIFEKLTINQNKIYYLKLSGSYVIGNLQFVVSSLVDNKHISYDQVTHDLTSIALYHGIIQGSKGLPSNNDRYKSKKSFDGFDFVLLGDIHLHQFLAPNMAYAGSLIQQNFGEAPDHHGVLVWDIINKTTQFHEIYNDFEFITITVSNNSYSIPTINKPNIYLRILYDVRNTVLFDEIISKIPQKICKMITSQYNNSLIDTPSISLNNTYQNIALIEQNYIKQRLHDLNSIHLLDKITSLHNSLKKRFGFDFSNSSSFWHINQLLFKNTYNYGNNHINEIDFNLFKGIVSITGLNTFGKSNIINILLFSIYYDKEIKNLYEKKKGSMIGDICNNESSSCMTSVDITINKRIYRFEKNFKGKKTENSVNDDTFIKSNELVQLNNTHILDVTDPINPISLDTQQKAAIMDIIGTKSEFQQLNIYTRESDINFSINEYIKVLYEYLGITKYESLFNEIKKECNENLKKEKFIEGSINQCKKLFSVDELNSLSSKIDTLTKSIQFNNDSLLHKRNSLKHLSTIKDNFPIFKPDPFFTHTSIKYIDYTQIIDFQNQINLLKSKIIDVEQPSLPLSQLESLISIKQKYPLLPPDTSIITIFDPIDKPKKIIGNLQSIRDQIKQLDSLFTPKLLDREPINKKKIDDKEFDSIRCSFLQDKIKLEMKLSNNNVSHTKSLHFSLDEVELEINDIKSILPKYKPPETIIIPLDFMDFNLIDQHINSYKHKLNTLVPTSIIKNVTEEPVLPFYDYSLKQLEKLLANANYELNNLKNESFDNVLSILSNKKILKTKSITYYGLSIEDFDYIDSFITQLANGNIDVDSIQRKTRLTKDILDLSNKLTLLTEYNILAYNFYTSKLLYFEQQKYSLFHHFTTYLQQLESFKNHLVNQKLLELKHNFDEIELQYYWWKNYEYKIKKQKLLHLEAYFSFIDSRTRIIQQNIVHKYNNFVKSIDNSDYTLDFLLTQFNNHKQLISNNIIKTKLLSLENDYFTLSLRRFELQTTVRFKYDSLYNDITQLNQLLITENTELAELSTKKDLIIKTMHENDLYIQQYNANKEIFELNQLYKKLIENIQKHILISLLDAVNSSMNDLIFSVLDLSVKFFSKSPTDIGFKIVKNNVIHNYNTVSGFEKLIIQLAFKVTLNVVGIKNKSNIFIIDEGLDVIDFLNIDKFKLMLMKMKNIYSSIFLISHMDRIKALCDKQITVLRHNNSSSLLY